jgi:hypothetical protein
VRVVWQRRAARPPSVHAEAVITIRLAGKNEQAAIEELAELSGRAAPSGRILVAEVDGRVLAALPQASREPIADPFSPTSELGALLSLRAAQLDATDPDWGRDEPAKPSPLRTPYPASRLAGTRSSRRAAS